MAFTADNIKKIANLARLSIEEKDIERYTADLSNILNLVEQINRADTTQIAPMAHPIDVTQRMRDDVVTETNQREVFQKIAPYVEAGLYFVPAVLEQEEG